MNIANSRALLLGLLFSLFALSVSAVPSVDGDNKATKKDIIIVNIDANLSDQLAGLAQYTYDLYVSNNKGIITIKKYLDTAHGDEQSIDELITLIKYLGVSSDDIAVKEETLTVNQPYFTLSISAGPDVQ